MTGTSFVDTTATPGTTYYYWVKASSNSRGADESDFSPSDTGYSLVTLSAPASITASDGYRGDGVALSWPTVSGATYYKVYRSTSELGTKVFSGWFSGTSLVDTTATPGETQKTQAAAPLSQSRPYTCAPLPMFPTEKRAERPSAWSGDLDRRLGP